MLQRRRFNESNSLRQWHFGNQQHLVTWYHLVQNYQILAFSSVVTEMTGLYSSSISWNLIDVVKQHSMSSFFQAPPRIPSGKGSLWIFFGTSSMYVSRCSATKKPFSCKKSTCFRWQHSNCDTPSSGENDLGVTLGNLRSGGHYKEIIIFESQTIPFSTFSPVAPGDKTPCCGTRYSPKIMPPRIAECTAEMILWIHLEREEIATDWVSRTMKRVLLRWIG